MSNSYEPQNVEEQFYKIWEDRKYFEVDGNKAIQKEGQNFAIMMPPPNVTGRLHIGHALTFTLQDIITRYKRMDGYKHSGSREPTTRVSLRKTSWRSRF